MAVRTIIIATCSAGCSHSRWFSPEQQKEADEWLVAHEATHKDQTTYVGRHDPRTTVTF